MERNFDVRGKHQWILPVHAPIRVGIRSPGWCRDWESSGQPFALRDDVRPTEPQQLGLIHVFSIKFTLALAA